MTDWLNISDQGFCIRVTVVPMNGFASCHSAAAKVAPAARTVTNPFQVVHLTANVPPLCGQRDQQATYGHRGQAGDPLCRIHRSLPTRQTLPTYEQKVRFGTAFVACEANTA
ncbi:transposase [Dietzia psychralcaliphila]|uniref:transposase n=1 Tax=Dietzia psychralcaliphila TaxID=139021 RepID=UPI000D2FF8F5|nr:transposase [Dietzia psychralcaliphila]PTM87181.1 transposase [Dietzia psychralcaliphila]